MQAVKSQGIKSGDALMLAFPAIGKAVALGVLTGLTFYYSEYAIGQFMLGWNSVI